MAILFPKLRMHFAEFLNGGFPAHLGILFLPTCVGFGTGTSFLTRGFSRQCGTTDFASPEGSAPYRFSALSIGDLPPIQPTSFDALIQSRAQSTLCVTSLFKRNDVALDFSPVLRSP